MYIHDGAAAKIFKGKGCEERGGQYLGEGQYNNVLKLEVQRTSHISRTFAYLG